MVLQILNEVHPGGVTANDILDQIQKRWMPTLERTSLSPQLSRLKQQQLVSNARQQWFLATEKEDEPVKASSAEGGDELGNQDSDSEPTDEKA
jgi:hypothetical protein